MGLWNSLPEMVRLVLLCVAFFAAGAVLSFGYSYRPLHGALTFKVEALEGRIDERNRENLALRDEIGLLKSGESSCIEPEELAEVERELGRVRYQLSESEASVERAERNLRDANSNANRWRERFHELRDSGPTTMPAATAPTTPPSRPERVESGDSATHSRRPEPLFDGPLEEFSVSPESPKPPERGILLPSDSQDPF